MPLSSFLQRALPLASALAVLAACAAPVPPATPSASQPEATNKLLGTWTRTQDCEGQLAAFEASGLMQSHADWITGNWVPLGTEGMPHDWCRGARPPEEHSHFFTADGQFGSYDANGNQVDDGDYEIVSRHTLTFPSHAEEFGYDIVLVRYDLDGDSLTFHVVLPADCLGNCLDAYAWAVSAFYDGDPWLRTN